jgi:hypothetical protein
MNTSKKILRFILTLLFSFLITHATAQQKIPIINAHSTTVDVRDGNNLYKGYWVVSPEAKKDIYYAHRSAKQKTVTFITDIDSISFKVIPGNTFDFIILLNNKDSCYTEISTLRTSYKKDGDQKITQDTIPFTLGNDNRIYIEGSINNSVPLRFFFDNGSDNTVIFPSSVKKGLDIKFDDSVLNNGIDVRKTSNFNNLKVARLKWDNTWVMYINKQIGDNADGTIGYDLFEDKIIEFDYDKMIMIVHDSSFKLDNSYSGFKMELNGGEVPFLETTLVIDSKPYKKFLMLDMGATGCIFLNQKFVSKNSLYDKMKSIGESNRGGASNGTIKTALVILPELRLGKFTLNELPINLQLSSTNDGNGELGMDVLKRFNLILDYQNNMIYMKPNILFKTPYKKIKSN